MRGWALVTQHNVVALDAGLRPEGLSVPLVDGWGPVTDALWGPDGLLHVATSAAGTATGAVHRHRSDGGWDTLADGLAEFPRVSDKLAMMLAEIVMARELTYFAAREKDKGRRCDIEAGMAKLLAARVAWSNADTSLQIHGGIGYALETEISRVLCDARILNIFEGAAEIQAQVIGRGLLSRQN